jgi:hypothetical protein
VKNFLKNNLRIDKQKKKNSVDFKKSARVHLKSFTSTLNVKPTINVLVAASFWIAVASRRPNEIFWCVESDM